jgi:hypothetical protein
MPATISAGRARSMLLYVGQKPDLGGWGYRVKEKGAQGTSQREVWEVCVGGGVDILSRL